MMEISFLFVRLSKKFFKIFTTKKSIITQDFAMKKLVVPILNYISF